jgi:hypothetical protein
MEFVTVMTLLNLSGEPVGSPKHPPGPSYPSLEACQEAVKKCERWLNNSAEASHAGYRFSWTCKVKP